MIEIKGKTKAFAAEPYFDKHYYVDSMLEGSG